MKVRAALALSAAAGIAVLAWSIASKPLEGPPAAATPRTTAPGLAPTALEIPESPLPVERRKVADAAFVREPARAIEPRRPAASPSLRADGRSVGVVYGIVTGPDGEPIEGASVSATTGSHFRPPSSPTGPDGYYEIALAESGTAFLRAIPPGPLRAGEFVWMDPDSEASRVGWRRAFTHERVEATLPAPPAEVRVDLRFGELLLLEGRIVRPNGEPLPRNEIPSGAWSRIAVRAIPRDGPSPEASAARLGSRSIRIQGADRDVRTAGYSVEWPEGAEAASVVLEYREVTLDERVARKGEAPPDLVLDPERIRAWLGSLRVRVLDARSLGPIESAEVEATARSGREAASGYGGARVLPTPSRRMASGAWTPARNGESVLRDLEAGTYAVRARAPGFVGRVTEAEVAPGRLSECDVLLEGACAVTIRLVGDEGPLPFLFPVEARDGSNRLVALPDERRSKGEDRVVGFEELPAGTLYLVARGSALPFRVSLGENDEIEMRVRFPRRLRLEVELPPVAEPREGKVEARTPEGITVGEARLPIPAYADRAEATLRLPPGDHEVRFEVGGETAGLRVSVGRADDQSLALRMP